MPTPASATPYSPARKSDAPPARKYAAKMVAATTTVPSTVLCMPIASPRMIVVAAPVCDASAMP